MLYKLFLFFCVYMPFQLALNPTEGIDLSSLRIFVLVLFLCCLADELKNKKIKIPSNIQTGLILTFIFLNILSVFVARNTDWSFRKLLFLFSVFPIYFVTLYLINQKEKIVSVMKGIVWGGLAAAALGIIQFSSQYLFGIEKTYKFWSDYVVVPFLGKTFSLAVLQNPSWLVNVSGKTYLRATAFFPDPHMFSFFLGIVAALTLSLVFAFKKTRVFYGTALFIILIADILTFSRGGYLGLAAGLIFLIIFFWKKITIYKKLAIFLSFFLLLTFLAIPNPFYERYASIFNFQEGSNKGRIEIWKKTLEIIEKKPWLGTGIGNYSLEIKPTAGYREPYYAHNTYLDIAAESGLPNAVVWVGMLLFFWQSFKKKAREEIIFLGPAISLVIFAVHSMVETALFSPVVLTLFLIVLGFDNVDIKCNLYDNKKLPKSI